MRMTPRQVLLALGMIVILTGCNLNSPLPNYDWCYRFDFTSDDYDFQIDVGNWVQGRGFVSDNAHHFAVAKVFGFTVQPNGIIAKFSRATADISPMQVWGSSLLFGSQFGGGYTTIPGDRDDITITRAIASSGDRVNADIYASRPFQWEALEVHGIDANPFGSSNCATTDSLGGTLFNIPMGDIFGDLQEADQELAGVNANLTSPDGTSLLPPASNLALLFSYAKWIVSPTAANSLAGPFAPIIVEFGLLIALEIVLLGIYLTVYLAVYIVRWVVWLFKLILAIIQAIESAIGGVVGAVLKFVR